MDLSYYKKIKYPLVFLLDLSLFLIDNKDEKITDEIIFYTLKYFFRFFYNYIINLDIKLLFSKIKDKYPRSYSLISSHQRILNLIIYHFNDLQSYANTTQKFILNKNLEFNINYWKNKLTMLKAINDSTFGDGFHLQLINYDNENKIYLEEKINRLKQIKDLLEVEFFKLNSIPLFTKNDFIEFDYKSQNKIYLKLYVKIKYILENNIKDLDKIKKFIDVLIFLHD